MNNLIIKLDKVQSLDNKIKDIQNKYNDSMYKLIEFQNKFKCGEYLTAENFYKTKNPIRVIKNNKTLIREMDIKSPEVKFINLDLNYSSKKSYEALKREWTEMLDMLLVYSNELNNLLINK